MKITILVDKYGSAIDRLAQEIERIATHHEIKRLAVHPKKNDIDTIYELSNLLKWSDIIDVHYWKSGEVAQNNFPDLFNSKRKILFHMNPYDAVNDVNKKYDLIAVGNSEIHSKIPYSHLVPYGIDLNLFKFNQTYIEDKIINMTVSRIEGKKGILEVAKACKELGYKLRLVGRVSSVTYVQEILDTGVVEFFENVENTDLPGHYYASMIHVCNSEDNFESGTLPILEAMACGIPVLTRNIGHVPDLYNGKNMVVRGGSKANINDIATNLKELVENRGWRLKLREYGWESVKNRNSERMVRNILLLYNQIYLPKEKLVSIIIPTKDKPEAFSESLIAALTQDYKKYEVIVADSGERPVKQIVEKAREHVTVPIKYLHFNNNGRYTLAEARNRAIVESEGEILVFCDDRIAMDKEAVSEFVKYSTERVWLWGMKDDTSKGFVENFSSCLRRDIVKHGMFNERMIHYGGMTQDIRTRFEEELGFSFSFIDTARAKGIKRAISKMAKRDQIIKAKLLLYKLYGR